MDAKIPRTRTSSFSNVNRMSNHEISLITMPQNFVSDLKLEITKRGKSDGDYPVGIDENSGRPSTSLVTLQQNGFGSSKSVQLQEKSSGKIRDKSCSKEKSSAKKSKPKQKAAKGKSKRASEPIDVMENLSKVPLVLQESKSFRGIKVPPAYDDLQASKIALITDALHQRGLDDLRHQAEEDPFDDPVVDAHEVKNSSELYEKVSSSDVRARRNNFRLKKHHSMSEAEILAAVGKEAKKFSEKPSSYAKTG